MALFDTAVNMNKRYSFGQLTPVSANNRGKSREMSLAMLPHPSHPAVEFTGRILDTIPYYTIGKDRLCFSFMARPMNP